MIVGSVLTGSGVVIVIVGSADGAKDGALVAEITMVERVSGLLEGGDVIQYG